MKHNRHAALKFLRYQKYKTIIQVAVIKKNVDRVKATSGSGTGRLQSAHNFDSNFTFTYRTKPILWMRKLTKRYLKTANGCK